jgi:hypothetical protein
MMTIYPTDNGDTTKREYVFPVTDTPFGIAVVCTMTASDVESLEVNEDRSKEWCEDFIFENGEAIHDAMVRAAFDAIETLS